jgi:hypothetical protein
MTQFFVAATTQFGRPELIDHYHHEPLCNQLTKSNANGRHEMLHLARSAPISIGNTNLVWTPKCVFNVVQEFVLTLLCVNESPPLQFPKELLLIEILD